MVRKGVQEQQETDVTKSIKIIKKSMYDEGQKGKPVFFYGIAIYHGDKEFYRPIYPFVRSQRDLASLRDFVNLYEKDLLAFYCRGHNYDFGCFVYGIGSGRKDKFRDEWFRRGVVIY